MLHTRKHTMTHYGWYSAPNTKGRDVSRISPLFPSQCWFANSIIPSPSMSWDFTIKEESSFAPFCHISINSWIFYYYYLFWCSNCPTLDQREPLWADSCVLSTRTLVLWALPYSATKMSMLILHYASPRLGIRHFSKEMWFFSMKNDIQKPRSGS